MMLDLVSKLSQFGTKVLQKMLKTVRKYKKAVKISRFSLLFVGGATRNRTGDRGVADLCLTAWPWRHIWNADIIS